MATQAPLRTIKDCRFYLKRGDFSQIRPITRGVYVLYRAKPNQRGKKTFEVFYIGVGGVAKNATSGMRGRLKSHHKQKEDWTHYSFFEVHDNVSREEILELEGLLLRIFRHDRRIKLDNKQKGSVALWKLSKGKR
jgi:hypothetical protein